MNDNIFHEAIKKYCKLFFKIATQTIFVSDTDLNFAVAEFNCGVILQISLTKRTDHNSVINRSDRLIPLFSRDTSVLEAFKDLNIAISDYLSAEQQTELFYAINHKVPYFRNTTRFYDLTKNQFFLIKEKKEMLWTLEAAKQDIQDIIEDNARFTT